MSAKTAAKFLELDAAADFLGNGSIEVNRYETEILDMVRRAGVLINRVPGTPASGHPHRYFEQTAIVTANFTDPRNISPTPGGPTRVERAAFIKALTAQTNLSMFDVDVTRMQGQFAQLEAKDINDVVNSILLLESSNIWTGNDTSLSVPTTIQYVGILTQATDQFTIAQGASIIDGLKAKVAAMISRTDFVVRPTAIYLNGVLGDYIDREAKAQSIIMNQIEVVAGIKVKALSTQAGEIPLIPDPFLQPTTDTSYGFAAPGSGLKNYFAAILTESEIERPTVHGGDGNMNPRLFQLGLLAGLQGQYVAVHFNAVILKAASYAHALGAIVRA